ncbi:MAG: divalent-cation tolerance protein CutA [Candidatus Omnitrophica bacterium]|nr:divalent-cation tolerance protein CutA [Candidatus Omnitrophota bacterium]
MAQPLVLLTTAGSLREARRLGRAFVNQRAAACVNLIPGIESWYRWQGKIQRGREVLLLIKTTTAFRRDLHRLIGKLHSYSLPEMIALPITWGEPRYLAWMRKNLDGPAPKVRVDK